MSMARLVVAAVVVEGRSKSEVARDYGLSRRWVVTLVQRFLAEGEASPVAPGSVNAHACGRFTPRCDRSPKRPS